MITQISLRKGTAAAWTAANPVLADGEQGLETDTRKVKMGNGVTAWASLAYSATGDVTLDGAQTLTNKTLTGYTETVYALAGTALDVANGTVQTKTLAANVTFTDSLAAGQSLVLMLAGGAANVVTWPTITWVSPTGNAPPTLTAASVLVFWKVGSVLYGTMRGSYV